MKKLLFLSSMLLSQAAQAQWAVLDEAVRDLVRRINNVGGATGQMANLSATSNLDIDFATVAARTQSGSLARPLTVATASSTSSTTTPVWAYAICA